MEKIVFNQEKLDRHLDSLRRTLAARVYLDGIREEVVSEIEKMNGKKVTRRFEKTLEAIDSRIILT